MEIIEIKHELITHDDRGYLIRVSGDGWHEQRNFRNPTAGAYFALEGVLKDFTDKKIVVYTDNPRFYSEMHNGGLEFYDRIQRIVKENRLQLGIEKYEIGSDKTNGSDQSTKRNHGGI